MTFFFCYSRASDDHHHAEAIYHSLYLKELFCFHNPTLCTISLEKSGHHNFLPPSASLSWKLCFSDNCETKCKACTQSQITIKSLRNKTSFHCHRWIFTLSLWLQCPSSCKCSKEEEKRQSPAAGIFVSRQAAAPGAQQIRWLLCRRNICTCSLAKKGKETCSFPFLLADEQIIPYQRQKLVGWPVPSDVQSQEATSAYHSREQPIHAKEYSLSAEPFLTAVYKPHPCRDFSNQKVH